MELVTDSMAIRVIVFDYDGTLVDSNAIKREAYRPLFPAGQRYDDLLAAVLEQNPAGTRRDIIREILMCTGASAAMADSLDYQVEELAEQYDQIATEGAISCEERPGVSTGLAFLSDRYPLYLLSATPESSLHRIVSAREWSSFFRIVRGMPCCKADELRAFAVEEGVQCEEILMVGDSALDSQAALEAGSEFLFMSDGMSMDVVLKRLN